MTIDKKQLLINEINYFINFDFNEPILHPCYFSKEVYIDNKLTNYLKDNNLTLLDIKFYSKNNDEISLSTYPGYNALMVMDNETKVRSLIFHAFSSAPIVKIKDLNLSEIKKIHKNLVLDEPYSSHFQRIRDKIDGLRKVQGKYLVFTKNDAIKIRKVNIMSVNFYENSVKLEYTAFEFYQNHPNHSLVINHSKTMTISYFIRFINSEFQYKQVIETDDELNEYKEKLKKSYANKLDRLFKKITK